MIPVDKERCQAEIKEGSFMTLGPRQFVRCENKPAVVVSETIPGKDGLKGSMSMCGKCFNVFRQSANLSLYTVEVIA